MRGKKILILAIAFGLLTSYLIYDYLSKVEKRMSNVQMEPVVVVSGDVAAKTVLTTEMLQLKNIPQEYINPQAAQKLEDAVGKVATTAMLQGEQVLKPRLIKPGEAKSGLAYAIPTGKRAMSVAVDDVSGVAGLIVPGDHVDVVAVLNIPTTGGPPYSLVILQDIQVLGVGSSLEASNSSTAKDGKDGTAGGDKKSTVTLAVTVEEARSLALSSQKGAIRLMLRSPIDNSTVVTTPLAPDQYLR